MLQTRLNQFRHQRPLYLAWGVHLFTATGAVWGLLSIMAIFQHDWQQAFLWMIVAVFVDGFDGILARRFRVKGLTPEFDGALLDNIIDYQTYVLVPALLLHEAQMLPTAVSIIGLALVLLSSAFQFCQTDAKTEDHTFKGFPSYWNVVVFYLFLMNAHPWFVFFTILFLAIMVFVPIKYAYPSRMLRFRRVTMALALIWGGMVTVALWQYPNQSMPLLWASLFYLVYYLGLSLYMMVTPSPKSAS